MFLDVPPKNVLPSSHGSVFVSLAGSAPEQQNQVFEGWRAITQQLLLCLDVPHESDCDPRRLSDSQIAVCACLGALPLPFSHAETQQTVMDVVLMMHEKYVRVVFFDLSLPVT